MDTIIYIDGYNLFYGRLRHTPYKWLDIFKLFQSITKVQQPSSNIIKIKYFTAPVKANFASHGQESASAQNAYHRALKYIYQHKLEIISGYHTVERGSPPLYLDPIDKDRRVHVWKFEEKQTDVNIALAMYKDARDGDVAQQILVSNDSDLEPVLKLISEELTHILIGLVIPRPRSESETNTRPTNKSLIRYADWTRTHILDEECQNAQLDDRIATNKKPIIKPHYW